MKFWNDCSSNNRPYVTTHQAFLNLKVCVKKEDFNTSYIFKKYVLVYYIRVNYIKLYIVRTRTNFVRTSVYIIIRKLSVYSNTYHRFFYFRILRNELISLSQYILLPLWLV